MPESHRGNKYMKAKFVNLCLGLDTNVIVARINDNAKNMPGKSCYAVNADYYNIFIRDGRIVGMPRPHGGPIYPRSKNCIKPPSLFAPRYTSFSVMTIPKDFLLKFVWDTELTFTSPVSDKTVTLNTSIALYPAVDDLYVPENMERFLNAYNILRAARAEFDNETYTVEDWKVLIGNGITEKFKSCVTEYLKNRKNYFCDASSLQDIDTHPLADSLYHNFNDIFKKYGLTLPEYNFYGFIDKYVKSLLDTIFKLCRAER